jgi:hypothetical protein
MTGNLLWSLGFIGVATARRHNSETWGTIGRADLLIRHPLHFPLSRMKLSFERLSLTPALSHRERENYSPKFETTKERSGSGVECAKLPSGKSHSKTRVSTARRQSSGHTCTFFVYGE